MKKLAMLLALMLVFAAIGCSSKNTVVGTWYSDRDDESVLTLAEDGAYSDGTWLADGQYVTTDNTITLTDSQGATTTLTIQTIDNETVLVFDDGVRSHSYYSTADVAQTARENRQADSGHEPSEQRDVLAAAIVGYWHFPGESPVEFTEDGTYISYSSEERLQGSYEVLTGIDISITEQDGTIRTAEASIAGDELSFEYTPGTRKTFQKATPIALSLDAIVGEWQDHPVTRVFTAEGVCIETDTSVDTAEEAVLPFTILGNDTMDIPERGGIKRVFLSETVDAYHFTINPIGAEPYFTSYMFREK